MMLRRSEKQTTMADFPELAEAKTALQRLKAERDALAKRIDDLDFHALNTPPTSTRFDPASEAQRLISAGTAIAPEPTRPTQQMPSKAELERDLAVLSRRVQVQAEIVKAMTAKAHREIVQSAIPAIRTSHQRIVEAVAELKAAMDEQDAALKPLRDAEAPVTQLQAHGVPLLAPPASKRGEWVGDKSRAAEWLNNIKASAT